MDRLNSMEIFVCVADVKSFTKAATILNISPASVTKAVQALEEHLSTRLLHRTTRRLSLTPEGEAVCESCRRIISDVADLAASDKDNYQGLRGRLRVDMPASLAKAVIVPALARFIELHPGIELILGVSDKSVDLIEDGIDCAIRVGPNSDSSLVAQTIAAMPRVMCAAPSYLTAHGKPSSRKELEGHSAIRYFPKGGWRDVGEEFELGGKGMEVKMHSLVAVNDVDTYLACGLQGLGIMRIGRYLVQGHLDSGRLVEIFPEGGASTPISVIYPARRHLPYRVRAFITWVTEVLVKHPSLLPAR